MPVGVDRLRATVRDDDLVARLGGDEFAVIVADPAGDLTTLAARIVAVMRAPILVAGTEVTVSASIGVAAAGDTPEGLLHQADLAMYAAKHAGRNRFEMAVPIG